MASKILLTAARIAATVTACASESSTDTQPLVARPAEITTQSPAPDARRPLPILHGEKFAAHDHREFRLCEENPYGR